ASGPAETAITNIAAAKCDRIIANPPNPLATLHQSARPPSGVVADVHVVKFARLAQDKSRVRITHGKSFSRQIEPPIGARRVSGLGGPPSKKSDDEEETRLCVNPVRRRDRLLSNRRKCASTQTSSFGSSQQSSASREPS